MNPIKVAVITGTRPELIKVSVLLRLLKKDTNFDLVFIHSGQHYDNEMFSIFLNELELPQLDYNIHVGSYPNSVQTGHLLIKLYEVIHKTKPDLILSQGDTNTVCAAALTAFKMCIPFGHIEAGIRSYDRSMPEEINRILAGSLAEFNFAPTENSVQNLIKEGIPAHKIYNVGNTIVDAINVNKSISEKKSHILAELNLSKNEKYVVLTVHRPSNVDNLENLLNIFKPLLKMIQIKLIFPAHPRTIKNLKRFGLWDSIVNSVNIILIKPVGYLDMLKLIAHSYFVLTDSGGLQEESVSLKKPCLTLRFNTERPESVDIGANILIGNDPKKIAKFIPKLWSDKKFYNKMVPKENPFGDGRSSQKILDILLNQS